MVTTQKARLEAELAEHGWRVGSRMSDEVPWWAHEIWCLDSEWSPRGTSLYLTFLFDPMDCDPGVAKRRVWAVGTSHSLPTSRREAEGAPLIRIGSGWEGRLGPFLTGLADLRG